VLDRIRSSKGGAGRTIRGRGAVRAGDWRGVVTRAHLSAPIFLAQFHVGHRSLDLHRTCEVEW
jgi:hypothetical protein